MVFLDMKNSLCHVAICLGFAGIVLGLSLGGCSSSEEVEEDTGTFPDIDVGDAGPVDTQQMPDVDDAGDEEEDAVDTTVGEDASDPPDADAGQPDADVGEGTEDLPPCYEEATPPVGPPAEEEYDCQSPPDGFAGDRLFVLDADGQTQWSVPVGPPGAGSVVTGAGPVIAEDDTIYVAAGNYLQAFDAEGQDLWRFPIGTVNDLTLAEDGSLLFVGRGWNDMLALQHLSTDGELLWSRQLPPTATRMTMGDGEIYMRKSPGVYMALEVGVDPANDGWYRSHGDLRESGVRSQD